MPEPEPYVASAPVVRVRDLGPIDVLVNDVPHTVGGAMPRMLLTKLAREAGRTVSASTLIAALWGTAAPPRADALLEQHVWRLRKVLEPDRAAGQGPRVLVRREDGYLLDVEPDAVDSISLEHLAADARRIQAAGDSVAALAACTAALDLWRGAPARECVDEPDPAQVRLVELREALAETAADAELAQGLPAAALVRLDAALIGQQLREGLWERRMLALYRLGRQAEALAAYREVRTILAGELGVEPGPRLQELHARILRHDPTLQPLISTPTVVTAAAPTVGAGLPEWYTSFVGRDLDLATLGGLIGRNRLVTVVGPGGIGKTRLAVEVARELASKFEDGAAFVDLSAVTSAEGVVEGVLTALRTPGTGDAATMTAVLRGLNAIIVLDNCEPVLDLVATAAMRIVRDCPRLRLLTTSREPLHLAGEQLWECRPLPVHEEAEPTDALALFTDRVRQVRPTFSLDETTRPLATEVVRVLDGLPLAVELAAGRVRTLGLSGLAERMTGDLAVLSGGDRGMPERHRSIAAAVDWGLRLATEPEQVLFRRLAVVPGGVTSAAATRCAGFEPLDPAGIPDLLDSLANRSLVFAADAGNTVRYRLLEPVRRRAADLLGQSGETDVVLARLLDHAIVVVADRPRAGAADRYGWYVRAEAEHPGISQAVTWGLSDAERFTEAALLVTRLNIFLTSTMRSPEALRLTRAALAGARPGSTLHSWLRGCEANTRINYGYLDESAEGFEVGIRALLAAGETEPAAELLVLWAGKLLMFAEALSRAADVLDFASEIQEAFDPYWLAALAGCRALYCGMVGDPAGWAVAQTAAKGNLGEAFAQLGEVHLMVAAGDPRQAEAILRRVVRMFAAAGSAPVHRFAALMARLQLQAGRPAHAARLFGFTHAQVRRFGPDATAALMRRFDDDLTSISAAIGSAGLAHAWSAGEAVSWSDMLAELCDAPTAVPVAL